MDLLLPGIGTEESLAELGPKQFSFEALYSATEGFDAKNELGKGGFAVVYKETRMDLGAGAVLPLKIVKGKSKNDGTEIAVKKPLRISEKEKELVVNEMQLLLESTHHRNIVKFLGVCPNGEETLFVFEYASNGSLDNLVFNKRTYDIIVGVARGLLYLHEHLDKVIIHCDIKPANILIDENWVPKIADFGTARLLHRDQTHVNTSEVVRTLGYSAPEYACHGQVSWKVDSYSFGVLVLELISGQRNWLFHDRSSNAQSLRDRANELYKEGRLSKFMDEKLIPSAVLDQVQLCVHIGVMCTEYCSELRPTMGRVYLMLSKNHSSSSTLLEELMRDGSSSASSTTRNSGHIVLDEFYTLNGSDYQNGICDRPHRPNSERGICPTELTDNGSSSWADTHMENKGLHKSKRLTRASRIKAEDVQSYKPSIPSSSCSSIDGPTEVTDNGSSSWADIHMENKGLHKNKRLTRASRIKAEGVQSYKPSIPSSSYSSMDGSTELANNGSSSEVDIHVENKGLSKNRRLTRAPPINANDVPSYIPSIPSSSYSSMDGSTKLANNGSSSEVDIHVENKGLSKNRRLTRAPPINAKDVPSYIPSIPSSSYSILECPTELAINESSSWVDIHLENEGLPNYR
ncbi:unnamed protein product [Camellia sinensis]